MKIYITQKDNDKYFNSKLATLRNGFCYIERSVKSTDDEDFYSMKTPKGQVLVFGSGDTKEIYGQAK